MMKTNETKPNKQPKKILVSACLYGLCTRYDGNNCILKNKTFSEWKNRGMLIPVCPEEMGGLSTPRNPSEITGDKVMTSSGEDVTCFFRRGADKALETAKKNNVVFAVLKDGSPSCGCKNIYDGSFSGNKTAGTGIFARKLLENGYLVFSENDISTAEIFLNEK